MTGTGSCSSPWERRIRTLRQPVTVRSPLRRVRRCRIITAATLPVTHAVFYDISDRAHPKVLKDYTIDGDYIDARLIGTSLYLVTREQVYLYDTDRITVPQVREGTKTVIAPDVYYFDNPERQYAFTTVSSYDTSSAGEKEAKTYLVGSGNILYVSEDAMYITYQKYHNIISPMRAGPAVAPVVPIGIAQAPGAASGTGSAVAGSARSRPRSTLRTSTR